MPADVLGWPWDQLGLDAPTQDAKVIRRAYARVLKSLPPDDAERFQQLRGAYDFALSRSDGARRAPQSRVAQATHDTPKPAEPQCPAPSAPPPASPWQEAVRPKKRLVDQVATMLAARMYQLSDWEPVFRAMQQAEPDAFRSLERQIIIAIGRNDGRPPTAWIVRADDIFGWRDDGVGFLRRFPDQQVLFELILKARPATAPAIDTKEKGEDPFWSWVAPPLVLGVLTFLLGLVMQARGDWTDENAANAISGAVGAGLIYLLIYTIWRAALLPLVRMVTRLHHKLARRFWGLEQFLTRPIRRIRPALALRLGFILWLGFIVVEPSRDRQVYISAAQVRSASEWLNRVLQLTLDAQTATTTAQMAIPSLFILRDFPMTGDLSADQLTLANLTFPSEMIRCERSPALPLRCVLAIRNGGTVLRAVEIAPGHPMEGWHVAEFGDAVLHISQGANQLGTQVSAHLQETYPRIESVRSPDQARLVQVRFNDYRLFAPELLADNLLLSHRDAAVTSPETQLALSLAWPEMPLALENSAQCLAPIDAQNPGALRNLPASDCDLADDQILRRLTIYCDQEREYGCKDQMTAMITGQEQPDASVLTDRTPWQITLSDPSHILMRQLAHRLVTPGDHPALPDSADLRLIRDQVIWQYAVVLNQPAKGDTLRNRDTLRLALRYQPQLQSVQTAPVERQVEIWQAMIAEMTRIGFDMRAVNGSVAR
ncbi:MAG: hypothetical protein II336_12305 [Loktanella sp.]|nr:hypothetical protein [Loktanella sp.]